MSAILIARTDIVGYARECLGASFRHEGRTLDGIDCVGIILWAWHRAGLPDYSPGGYGRSPNPRRMTAQLDEKMQRISIAEATVADVWHLAWKDQPQHLAILTPLGIIHSYEAAGRVIEHPIDQQWRARVRHAYRFPGVV